MKKTSLVLPAALCSVLGMATLTGGGQANAAPAAPCMAVLDRFTAPDVPAMGPDETASPPGGWVNAVTPPPARQRPGAAPDALCRRKLQ